MINEYYDVIVIGSGIAGMTSAMYLKRSGINVLIIEENMPGGQLNKIRNIENYPGYKKIDGSTLGAEIYNQVRDLDIIYLFDKVVGVNLNDNEKEVFTRNNKLRCKYLVIATGKKSKKLFDIDEKYIGKGISYCATCDGNLYKNKNVVVVGNNNESLEDAIYLSKICKNVTVVSNEPVLKGKKELIDQICNINNIKCMYNLNIKEYNIEDNKLVSLVLDNNDIILADGLFISIGSSLSTDIFQVKKENGYIIVDNKYMTSIENVYACGDVIKKDLYQLITAASEGAIVATNIIKKNKI